MYALRFIKKVGEPQKTIEVKALPQAIARAVYENNVTKDTATGVKTKVSVDREVIEVFNNLVINPAPVDENGDPQYHHILRVSATPRFEEDMIDIISIHRGTGYSLNYTNYRDFVNNLMVSVYQLKNWEEVELSFVDGIEYCIELKKSPLANNGGDIDLTIEVVKIPGPQSNADYENLPDGVEIIYSKVVQHTTQNTTSTPLIYITRTDPRSSLNDEFSLLEMVRANRHNTVVPAVSIVYDEWAARNSHVRVKTAVGHYVEIRTESEGVDDLFTRVEMGRPFDGNRGVDYDYGEVDLYIGDLTETTTFTVKVYDELMNLIKTVNTTSTLLQAAPTAYSPFTQTALFETPDPTLTYGVVLADTGEVLVSGVSSDGSNLVLDIPQQPNLTPLKFMVTDGVNRKVYGVQGGRKPIPYVNYQEGDEIILRINANQINRETDRTVIGLAKYDTYPGYSLADIRRHTFNCTALLVNGVPDASVWLEYRGAVSNANDDNLGQYLNGNGLGLNDTYDLYLDIPEGTPIPEGGWTVKVLISPGDISDDLSGACSLKLIPGLADVEHFGKYCYNIDFSGFTTQKLPTTIPNMFEMKDSNLLVSRIPDIDTSNVTSFYNAFRFTPEANVADITTLNFSNALNINNLFTGGDSSPASVVNTATHTLREGCVVDMMFSHVSIDFDLTLLDISKVTTAQYMFNYAKINTALSGWDISSLTDIRGMFNGATINAPIDGWTLSNISNADNLFEGATINAPVTNWSLVDVASSNVIFKDAVVNSSIGGWDLNTTTSMVEWFANATLTTESNVGTWDVSGVTSIYAAFVNASISADLSGWDVSNVGSAFRAFYLADFKADINIGNWNPANMTNMDQMFANVINFNQNLSNWKVPRIIEKPINFITDSSVPLENYPQWGVAA